LQATVPEAARKIEAWKKKWGPVRGLLLLALPKKTDGAGISLDHPSA
jgi:hypothetical protein